MHDSVLEFAASKLTRYAVKDKHILEVGSLDVNGSIRADVEVYGPATYTGIDLVPGKGVDVACDAADLLNDPPWYDVVIALEMLEHAPDWQSALGGCIQSLNPGGHLYLTTRSPGFMFHGTDQYDDYWRFPPVVMKAIIVAAGLIIVSCTPDTDPASPGVFCVAAKPPEWEWPEHVETCWDALAYGVQATERPLNVIGHRPAPEDAHGIKLPTEEELKKLAEGFQE